jgi:putative ABC transport system permease protein
VLIARLAARDLRRRPVEAALLFLTLAAATTVLTMALIVRGVTSDPYQNTRVATTGPDVVASTDPRGVPGQPEETPPDAGSLDALAREPGVVGHSGPHPVFLADLATNGRTGMAYAIGRATTPASVDQPKLTEGSWIAPGNVVLEAAFADALGVGAGNQIAVNGRSFTVAGVAVSAAMPPYPEIGCFAMFCMERTGVLWLTEADALGLPPPLSAGPDGKPLASEPSYVTFLKLEDPALAPAFARSHASVAPAVSTMAWQEVRDQTAQVVRNQRQALLIGSRLIALLAVASVAVLVGGRMAGQSRRVGLLKAVGGTPGLAAVVLLAEYVAIALGAAAAGLTLGRLCAPLLTDPSTGLLGSAGSPSLSISTAVQVTALALGVAVAATLVPAVRASRTSTVLALADAARPPRRTAWFIATSARLPLPLLLGLRMAARRPRRAMLSAASIFVTVSGIVAALGAHALPNVSRLQEFGLPPSRTAQLNQALLMITITLAGLAAANAIFITSATVTDNRHFTALARALGATPAEMSEGLSAAQLLSAITGAILGIPGGLALIDFVSNESPNIPLWQLVVVVPCTVLALAALTAIPSRLGARRPVAEVLQAELV